MNTLSAFSTNASAQILRNSLANQSLLATAIHQLSSGVQLNTPADGPAQYAQASQLQTAVASYDAAAASAQQGALALNIASSAIMQIQSAVQSLHTLSIAAANTDVSAQQRAVLQAQAEGYVSEISQISGQTTFQGTELIGLNTTAATSTTTTTSTNPTVVQSATGTTGNFNTPVISLSLAQAPTAGNLLVALVTYGNGYGGNQPSQAVVAPSGWTLITSVNDNQYSGTDIFVHTVTAGDPSTYTFTGATRHDEGTGTIVEIANANTSNPIVTSASSATATSSAATVMSPSLTATGAGELPLAIFAFHYLPQTAPSGPSYGTGWQSLTDSPNTYYASETQVGTATTGAGSVQTGYTLSNQDASGNEVESAAVLIQGNTTTQTTTTPATQGSIFLGAPSGGMMFTSPLPNLSAQNLGIANIDLTSADSANSAMVSAEAALATIGGQLTRISSLQMWLQTLTASNTITSLNISQAASSLQDAPIPQDLATYTRQKLLNAVNTSLLANTNSLAKGVFSLLSSAQSNGIYSQATTGNSTSLSSMVSYR